MDDAVAYIQGRWADYYTSAPPLSLPIVWSIGVFIFYQKNISNFYQKNRHPDARTNQPNVIRTRFSGASKPDVKGGVQLKPAIFTKQV